MILYRFILLSDTMLFYENYVLWFNLFNIIRSSDVNNDYVHRMGDKNLSSLASPRFGRHVKLLLPGSGPGLQMQPAVFAVLSTCSNFKED
jgi:hypothetical protein